MIWAVSPIRWVVVQTQKLYKNTPSLLKFYYVCELAIVKDFFSSSMRITTRGLKLLISPRSFPDLKGESEWWYLLGVWFWFRFQGSGVFIVWTAKFLKNSWHRPSCKSPNFCYPCSCQGGLIWCDFPMVLGKCCNQMLILGRVNYVNKVFYFRMCRRRGKHLFKIKEISSFTYCSLQLTWNISKSFSIDSWVRLGGEFKQVVVTMWGGKKEEGKSIKDEDKPFKLFTGCPEQNKQQKR